MMFAWAVLGFLIAFGMCASITFTILLPLFLILFSVPSVAVWVFIAGCVMTTAFVSLVRWYYDSYIEEISDLHRADSQLQARSTTSGKGKQVRSDPQM